MINAAAYIRVSTDDQTEYSPDAQKRAIQNYCKSHDMLLLSEHIYIDEGKSGRKAEKRPAFMQMIGTAKQKPSPFEVILVHKFDRFARNREDSVVYKKLLSRDCGVKVISITETIENDKMSLIMESMLEAMAEYYSINLSEEVKKGMTEKARRGEPLSIAPFGYIMKDKKLVVNEEEAKIIKLIFQKFLSGTGYLKIAKDLNAMGIKTHRGNYFENRTVEYILRNPVYKGYIRWNPTERTRRNYDHKDIMIVKGTHTPLVSEEDFEKAQYIVKELKKMYKPYYKTQYRTSSWLVGLCQCPTCQKSMINSGGYFVCSDSVRGRCTTRNGIKKEKLEKLVLEKIKFDADNTTAIDVNSFKSQKEKENEEDINTKLLIANDKLNRIKEAYRNGVDTLEEYKQNKIIVTKEIDEFTKKLQIAKEKLLSLHSQAPSEILKNVYEELVSPTNTESEKNAFAKEIIKTIIYDKSANSLTIRYYHTEL